MNDRAHKWFKPAWLKSAWECCEVCGIVRREDGIPNRPCKGPVSVGPRAEITITISVALTARRRLAMTERKWGKKLACGCVLGYERCFDCRPGLHPDQEIACGISAGEIDPVDVYRRTAGESARFNENADCVMGHRVCEMPWCRECPRDPIRIRSERTPDTVGCAKCGAPVKFGTCCDECDEPSDH